MKKILVAVLVLAMTLTLAACGKVECDLCGEMKTCKTTSVLGEEINVCNDCIDMFK